METLKKIKQFYLSNQTMITFAGTLLLLFAHSLWSPLVYVLMAFILCSYALSSVENALMYTMFLMFFSGVLAVFITSLAGVVLVLLTRYVIDVVRHKVEFYKIVNAFFVFDDQNGLFFFHSLHV